MSDQIDPQWMGTLDIAAKTAIALGAIKVFLEGIYKPFVKWRRAQIAKTMREVLEEELKQFKKIVDDEADCAENMTNILRTMRVVFEDLDKFLDIAHDNRERLDETNELIDHVFSLDRRVDLSQRAEIDALMASLRERQVNRKRGFTEEIP